ncbi:hypothetical protein [Candidatus Williamhamiltonella defendens]|uniref:Uncharacterized protein n=1 Tax=Candidatus Hamiltonella defensa (Bemisia tabaci) TaxID=672795 RepID=A0A249DZH8_9ENTR|nr:hypothetical protein [Candidatus Hamiltonella defensa]ASX26956.1 hypothetical protein BA171_08195 [Candidatus Hamiltonella defensa (Bemisia tabaci)]
MPHAPFTKHIRLDIRNLWKEPTDKYQSRYFNRLHDDNESKRLPLKKRRKLKNVADKETPSMSRERVSSPAETEKGRALTHKEIEKEGESYA